MAATLMRKFLKYEMDNYLRSRGRGTLKERPLLTVEANQGYIHYRKGSVVYVLPERDDRRRGGQPGAAQSDPAICVRATTLSHFVCAGGCAYRSRRHPNCKYLIKDLFEDITLFSNRTLDATAHSRADGKYDVTIKVGHANTKLTPRATKLKCRCRRLD